MRPAQFTRPTNVAAAEMLERHTQANFDTMVFRVARGNQIPEGAHLGRMLRSLAARPLQQTSQLI